MNREKTTKKEWYAFKIGMCASIVFLLAAVSVTVLVLVLCGYRVDLAINKY